MLAGGAGNDTLDGGADNDATTLKVAGPHDLFLHVRGTPGAHVIVPLERGEEIAEQTLLDAATLEPIGAVTGAVVPPILHAPFLATVPTHSGDQGSNDE